jgi:hypothetical protein
MSQLVLRVESVRKILKVCRTDAYEVISEIKQEYPYSKKLKGSKVRTEDLAHAYDLKVEDIYRTLKE